MDSIDPRWYPSPELRGQVLDLWTIRVESVRVTAVGVPKLYCNPTQVRWGDLPILTWKDFKRDQAEDPLFNLAASVLRRGQWSPC